MGGSSTNSAGGAEKGAEGTEGVQVGVLGWSNRPLTGDRVAVEEHGYRLKEDGGGFVEAESFP